MLCTADLQFNYLREKIRGPIFNLQRNFYVVGYKWPSKLTDTNIVTMQLRKW